MTGHTGRAGSGHAGTPRSPQGISGASPVGLPPMFSIATGKGQTNHVTRMTGEKPSRRGLARYVPLIFLKVVTLMKSANPSHIILKV